MNRTLGSAMLNTKPVQTHVGCLEDTLQAVLRYAAKDAKGTRRVTVPVEHSERVREALIEAGYEILRVVPANLDGRHVEFTSAREFERI